MSQPFEIDTDALGRAEAPFRELAAQLAALSDEVQQRVRGLGAVWGDDKTGQQFVGKYGPARDQLLEGFRSTAEVVRSTADGVHTMSQGFARTEDANREVNEGLLRRMDVVEPTTAGEALQPARRAALVRGAEVLQPTRSAPLVHAREAMLPAEIRQPTAVEPTQEGLQEPLGRSTTPTPPAVEAVPAPSQQAALRPATARVAPGLPLDPTQSPEPRQQVERLQPTQSLEPRQQAERLRPTQSVEPRQQVERLRPTQSVEPRQQVERLQPTQSLTPRRPTTED